MKHIIKRVIITLVLLFVGLIVLSVEPLFGKHIPERYELEVCLAFTVIFLLFALSHALIESKRVLEVLAGEKILGEFDSGVRFKRLVDELIAHGGDRYLRRTIWRLLRSDRMNQRLKENAQDVLEKMQQRDKKVFHFEIQDLQGMMRSASS